MPNPIHGKHFPQSFNCNAISVDPIAKISKGIIIGKKSIGSRNSLLLVLIIIAPNKAPTVLYPKVVISEIKIIIGFKSWMLKRIIDNENIIISVIIRSMKMLINFEKNIRSLLIGVINKLSRVFSSFSLE